MFVSRAITAVSCTALVLLLVIVAGEAAQQQQQPGSVPQKESNYHTTGYQAPGAAQQQAAWSYADFSTWPQSCRTGSRQSPISFVNVDPSEVTEEKKLRRLEFSSACVFKIEQTKMEITNDGNIINVMFETDETIPGDMSPCTVQDPLDKTVVYHFLGLHFHANSEHKFRNIVPDVEMHLVFGTEAANENKQKVLEVAILLKASASINTTSVRALRHILVEGSLPLPHTKTTCFLTEELPLLSFLPNQENYLVYDGSDTFPPCRENVRWVIMTSPVLISRLALGKLRNAMDETMPNDFHRYGNARPPQPLNGRRIYRYVDGKTVETNEGNTKDIWKKHDTPVGATQAYLLTSADVQAWALVTDTSANDSETDSAFASTQPAESHNETEPNYEDGEGKDEDKKDEDSGADATIAPSQQSSATPADAVSAHNVSASLPSSSLSSSASASQPTSRPSSGAGTSAGAASSNTATPAPSSSSSASSATTTTSTSTTTTTTTTEEPETTSTTSTKKPSTKESGDHKTSSTKAPSKKSKSGKGNGVEKDVESAATTTVQSLESKGRQMVADVKSYAQAHPGKLAAAGVLAVLLIFTIIASCRAWRRPSYVAGVDPGELEPLTGNGTGAYGATAAPVQPPMP